MIGSCLFFFFKGHSVHETSEEGESLLSLACSAGYFKLAQILLAMRANVEDRGIKVNARGPILRSETSALPLVQSYPSLLFNLTKLDAAMHNFQKLPTTCSHFYTQGDCTPLMEAASGGYNDIVKLLMEH